MDPQLSLEWDMSFGEELLGRLEQDLKSVPAATPIVLFNHFPLGAGGQFVRDDDDFLRLIKPFAVRAAFGGHIHRLSTNQTNGFTQVIGNGVIMAPVYYWIERRAGRGGPYLEVTEVTVPAAAPVSQRVVATAPLSGPGPGGDYAPVAAPIRVRGDQLIIRIRTTDDEAITAGQAGLIAEGNGAPAWQPLAKAADGWSGAISLAGVPAGIHRVGLRV